MSMSMELELKRASKDIFSISKMRRRRRSSGLVREETESQEVKVVSRKKQRAKCDKRKHSEVSINEERVGSELSVSRNSGVTLENEVNLSDSTMNTEDDKSKRSVNNVRCNFDVTYINSFSLSQRKKSEETCTSSKLELSVAGSVESSCNFSAPDFLNDKKKVEMNRPINLPNLNMHINLENKELYLVNSSYYKGRGYLANMFNSNDCEIEEFNENIYFNFD